MSGSGDVHVLVMEDDPGLARLMQKRLERQGYRVDLAHDGEQGLSMAMAGGYDVLILDQVMPIYTGLDVIRALRATGRDPLPPMIMVTGTGSEQIAVEALKLGARDYLVKDTEGGYLDLLPAVIVQVLEQQRLATERQQALEALQARARQQAAVADLGLQAIASKDLEALLDEAIRVTAETLQVEYCKVLELLPDGEHLLLKAGVGWADGLVGQATVSASLDSQAGYTLLSGEPVIVDDLAAEDRFSGPPLLHDHGVVSGMSVIIQGTGRPFGVMAAHTARRRRFTQDDVTFLQAMANVLAEAIQRRRAEQALQAYSERLEEMVNERTQELQQAQEQLVRREKLAVLGQLAGGVAHDLRNPLGVITNAIYLLRMLHGEDETTGEYLDIIQRETQIAEDIVGDLLDFARTREPQRVLADVKALIAGALSRYPPPENIAVSTHLATDLPPAFVDPRQIEQVLVNLITNACQAMSDGGRLVIRAERVEEGETGSQGDKEEVSRAADRQPPASSRLLVSVSDTGTGIAPEHMAKLFEPLFTTKARGIGLGLTTSRRLVEINGGSIEVVSPSILSKTDAERPGSTFTIYLPAREEAAWAVE